MTRSVVFIACAVAALVVQPTRKSDPPAGRSSRIPRSAPVFDSNVLQEIRLDINSKDADAEGNYQSNAYYPSDFRWGAIVVRNISIRPEGPRAAAK